VNGDGVDDLLIGAFLADPNGMHQAGDSYVVFGRAADTDGDGMPDRADNCTLLANADQRDTDGDGYGSVCDPDLDHDGIVNFSDLGALKTVFFTGDPNADFDGDGNVNFKDLGTMKACFFRPPPGPSGVVTSAWDRVTEKRAADAGARRPAPARFRGTALMQGYPTDLRCGTASLVQMEPRDDEHA
jgi:Thrombospondin type 3 repeat